MVHLIPIQPSVFDGVVIFSVNKIYRKEGEGFSGRVIKLTMMKLGNMHIPQLHETQSCTMLRWRLLSAATLCPFPV